MNYQIPSPRSQVHPEQTHKQTNKQTNKQQGDRDDAQEITAF